LHSIVAIRLVAVRRCARVIGVSPFGFYGVETKKARRGLDPICCAKGIE